MCPGWGPWQDADPLVRSDLPLSFTEQWPQPSSDPAVIGEESIFAAGDWRSEQIECPYSDKQACVGWIRWDFGGPLASYFVFSEAQERQYLLHGHQDVGIVGALGKGPPPANLDLFSIQFGARGGSQHLLVSASRGSLIKRLTVLSVACQGANGKAIPIRDIEFRASAAVGGLRTDYCVAKSSAGLRALAVAALGRKPAAVLEWVGDVPAAESPYTP